MKKRHRIERLWPGATIACLATGPSLTQEDCDYVRGKSRVIAINDAHRLAPWADVLFSADRQWWRYYDGVPTFAGMKIGIGSAPGKDNPFGPTRQHPNGPIHPGYPDIVVLKNTGYNGLETESNGLRHASNSGYAAINLAMHFGAARILLLGYNMGFLKGRAHFFGNHPQGLNQNEALYSGFRSSFDDLVEPLKALGIEVINCTPETSLIAFPVRDLREVLTAPLAVAS